MAVLLVVGTVLTWFTLRDRSPSTVLGGPTSGDSVPLAATPPADTGPLADSALAARVVALGDLTTPRTTRPSARDSQRTAAAARAARTLAARTARLEIVGADSARLYVDNRLVGIGRYSGDFPVATKLAVRAVIANASTSCITAERDTVVTLKGGDRASVSLPVRGCAVVSYDVTPRDARVSFTPLDGGPTVELRADSARALSLPEGRYEVRIQAPRCVMGTDTLLVAYRADGSPISRRFPLICS
ncbi:hypothetical protein [Gemmatimonas sp.]|uniref:hypothetical protein n=1 Tax=Gemmatimonas sp. TaxID=1962908 RepID=UPI00286E7CB1|nr:hypothetical protein [Gemmatimonas sp.]